MKRKTMMEIFGTDGTMTKEDLFELLKYVNFGV